MTTLSHASGQNEVAGRIRQQFVELTKDEPHIHARNAAQKIGITEAELLASHLGSGVYGLTADWENILLAAAMLGELRAITRNDACVHERIGHYENLSFSKHGPRHMGLALNPEIDLRLFLHQWRYGYAVMENMGKSGRASSLQFFDEDGHAVHKIYTTDNTNTTAYCELVNQFKDKACEFPHIAHIKHTHESRPGKAGTDAAALERDWRAMRDVHEFFPLLKKHNVSRLSALGLMPKDLANQITVNGVQRALQEAAARACEIMVFVGNGGCIQIHSGTVSNLKQIGPWFNVLDERFDLHLNGEKIEQCWVTRKPSDDGVITSIEAYDEGGELAIQLFGKRKPGDPELSLWRDIVKACECTLNDAETV